MQGRPEEGRAGTDVVHVGRVGRVGVVTLQRPERRNALHRDMFDPIRRALADFARSDDVGCVVLTGAGPAFCAGGDVRDGRPRRADGTALSDDERAARLTEDAELAVALHEHRKLTIAALNGPAVGAGLALALACDLRIAARSARLVPGYGRLALSGDYGAAWFLTRLVGPGRALELLAGDVALGAEEAQALGLVNRVVADDGFAEAWRAWATELADGPTAAIAAMKANVADAALLSLREALPREAQRMVASSHTPEHAEAVRAWLERRPPDFGSARAR